MADTIFMTLEGKNEFKFTVHPNMNLNEPLSYCISQVMCPFLAEPCVPFVI
jgi:hypothetical protein